MNDEMFIKKYEELLDKGYCDCNEMNCIDNNTPRRILNVVKNLQQEKEELINYLKEQIKHIDDLITKGKPKPYGEELNLYENSKLRYLEILSKIEKSDK